MEKRWTIADLRQRLEENKDIDTNAMIILTDGDYGYTCCAGVDYDEGKNEIKFYGWC